MVTPPVIDPKRREQWEREAGAYVASKFPMKSEWDRPERYHTMMLYEVRVECLDAYLAAREVAEVEIEQLKADAEYSLRLFKEKASQLAGVRDAYLRMLDVLEYIKQQDVFEHLHQQASAIARKLGWIE